MKPNRPLIVAAYLTALLLVIVPLGETAVTVMPFRTGNLSWRFGSMGLFSQALMTPAFGLVLTGAIALALGHRWMLRAVSVLAGLLTPVFVVLMVLFALDAIELRSQLRPEAAASFDVAAIQALVRLALLAMIAAPLAVGGWKASRRSVTQVVAPRSQPVRAPEPKPAGREGIARVAVEAQTA